MNTKLSIKLVLSTLGFFSLNAFGQVDNHYFNVEGSQMATINVNEYNYGFPPDSTAENRIAFKTIQIMTITPSEKLILQNTKALEKLRNTPEKDYTNGVTPFNKSAGAVDLAMSNVPVLDQGPYGTCVTFSSTAALDARFRIGDYIDQQCTLTLAYSLGQNYWNGANSPEEIFVPLKQYGLIPHNYCFGYTYPTPYVTLDVNTYNAISYKGLSASIKWTYRQGANLTDVKKALKSGQRVLTGFMLQNSGEAISVNGFNVKVEGKTNQGGLWACAQPGNTKNYCSVGNAGHEVIITGYDDKQELLKIRNSWTTQAGDNGEFYMTYSFFNAMAGDYTIVN